MADGGGGDAAGGGDAEDVYYEPTPPEALLRSTTLWSRLPPHVRQQTTRRRKLNNDMEVKRGERTSGTGARRRGFADSGDHSQCETTCGAVQREGSRSTRKDRNWSPLCSARKRGHGMGKTTKGDLANGPNMEAWGGRTRPRTHPNGRGRRARGRAAEGSRPREGDDGAARSPRDV